MHIIRTKRCPQEIAVAFWQNLKLQELQASNPLKRKFTKQDVQFIEGPELPKEQARPEI